MLIPSSYDKTLFGVFSVQTINASILTKHIVSKVDYSLAERIEVTCIANGKLLKASKVVVTVPIGVLQMTVLFVPALPTAKRKAINALGRASINNK
mgnify:CR=1 FL=1